MPRIAVILGAPDPEMEMIERILRVCCVPYVYATCGGKRVHPGNAYNTDDLSAPLPDAEIVLAVECGGPAIPNDAVIIDHHRPGDPGYGRPPAEYLQASSIGQVLDWLGIEPTDEHRLVAAADHCLAAAYRGECPGVDPDALMRWRIESRARFQRRDPAELLADVEATREALLRAPRIELGGLSVCDMREVYVVDTVLIHPFSDGAKVDQSGVGDSRAIVFGPRDEGAWDEGSHHISVRRGAPELPEAAMREGVAYLAIARERDGWEKIVLGGHTTPEVVRTFMDEWAPTNGLVRIYGDPARGFAGAYL